MTAKHPADAIISALPPNDGREWDCQCARCGSSVMSEDCETCGGEGTIEEDIDEFDDGVCVVCDGDASWWVCPSDAEYCEAHPLPGREQVERGEIEWFAIPEGVR